jgi:hypothetical protein
MHPLGVRWHNGRELPETLEMEPRDRQPVVLQDGYEEYVAHCCSDHETQLAGYMAQQQDDREKIEEMGGDLDNALQSHYGRGTKHPDDVNYPLSKWNDIP